MCAIIFNSDTENECHTYAACTHKDTKELPIHGRRSLKLCCGNCNYGRKKHLNVPWSCLLTLKFCNHNFVQIDQLLKPVRSVKVTRFDTDTPSPTDTLTDRQTVKYLVRVTDVWGGMCGPPIFVQFCKKIPVRHTFEIINQNPCFSKSILEEVKINLM